MIQKKSMSDFFRKNVNLIAGMQVDQLSQSSSCQLIFREKWILKVCSHVYKDDSSVSAKNICQGVAATNTFPIPSFCEIKVIKTTFFFWDIKKENIKLLAFINHKFSFNST